MELSDRPAFAWRRRGGIAGDEFPAREYARRSVEPAMHHDQLPRNYVQGYPVRCSKDANGVIAGNNAGSRPQ